MQRLVPLGSSLSKLMKKDMAIDPAFVDKERFRREEVGKALDAFLFAHHEMFNWDKKRYGEANDMAFMAQEKVFEQTRQKLLDLLIPYSV